MNGTCVDGVANYTCNCVPGFTGFNCDVGTMTVCQKFPKIPKNPPYSIAHLDNVIEDEVNDSWFCEGSIDNCRVVKQIDNFEQRLIAD